MKIISLILKDLRLFKRDKRTLITVILAPLIILFILGNIFNVSGEDSSIKGISLGYCNLDSEKLDFSSPVFRIVYLNGNCDNLARTLVSEGKLKGAIVIPKGFSQDIKKGQGSNIILYVDNSKTQMAVVIIDAMKAFVQDSNERVSVEFIQNAWDRLILLNKKLKFVNHQLITVKENALSAKKQISEFNETLNELSTGALSDERLNFTFDISEFNSSTSLDNTLENLISLNNGVCLDNGEICNITTFIINNLEDLVDREQRLNSLFDGLNNQFNSDTGNVSIIQQKNELKNKIAEMDKDANEYIDQIVSLIDELNETSVILDTYTSKNPQNIVRPVTLSSNNVFGKSTTYFKFWHSGVMTVILLFTLIMLSSSNVVHERNNGTMARTFLTPISKFSFLLGKSIYFLILSLIEIIVLLLLSMFFGVYIALSFKVFLILLLISFNFIMLGLFVGSFSKTENVALLTSLVISIPMLFLSGIFFPFEIMPPFMESLGLNLPLTLSVLSLEKLWLYNTTVDIMAMIKLFFIAAFIFLFTWILIKRKPISD